MSARGLDAAAYAEEVRAALRECLHQSPDAPAALACLNDAVPRVDASADRERMGETYASAAVAVVDTVTGVMDCACAGMEPPFVLRPSSGEAIEMGPGCGPLLGARAGAAYHSQSFALWRGDLLVLAGDGLAEARGIGSRVFGRDRLVAAVREAHLGERPLAEVGEAVIQRVKTFTGRRPYEDVCLLLARRV